MIELADAARNKWASILPALGIEAHFLTGKQRPCPICGGTDRFRFDDKDGRGTWYCNRCKAGDGISLLQKVNRWTFREAADQVRPLLGEMPETRRDSRPSRDPIEMCRQLWQASRRLADGDFATGYLRSRGIAGVSIHDLRFHPACRVSRVDGVSALPAMLALVRAPDGEPTSVHRTYLDGPAKAKIDSVRRMMPGTLIKGSAVRLAPIGPQLGVAEGIETALRVQQRFGIPCWAALNANMMREFIWPTEVEELIVFGDNDDTFVGQAAAYHLAMRARTAPKPLFASVEIPPEWNTDWADLGAGEARDAA